MNPGIRFERKVTKIGNSLGVTLTEALKELGIDAGDSVNVEVINGKITIEKDNRVELPEGISPDFFDSFNKLIANYDQTLRNLKDR